MPRPSTLKPFHPEDECSPSVRRALRVIRLEAAALARLARELPDGFDRAVELILSAAGRVIVSGIGKSGHIGRKIASTLASTGTPAIFIHATEASHGDMGVIARGDICLVISMSGETEELRHIVSHSRRHDIPLVAVSRTPGSTMVKAADVPLLLPDAPEACAIGLAPTTSAVLTLALGDALAVSLMEERGFCAESFRRFHPGGQLGARLAQVQQLMRGRAELPLVGPETSIVDTLFTMTSRGFGVALLVKHGRLAGVVSDGDLRRNMDGLMSRRAGDIATTTPVTIAPEALAVEALAMMQKRKISTIIVIDEGRQPIGLLQIYDCLRAGLA